MPYPKGKQASNFIDLTGQKFARLTVLGQATVKKDNKACWHCLCDCGNEIVAVGKSLRTGNTRSCGCYRNDRQKEANKTHGMTHTKLYKRWKAMKDRCYNPNDKGYVNYGSRGIMVCDEWRNDFQAFYDWAMANGYSEELEIDRENNDDNYEPNNCRWINGIIQNRNRRINKRNSSGTKDVSFHKTVGKWRARISVNYERICLGFYETQEAATQARKEAEQKYWKES